MRPPLHTVALFARPTSSHTYDPLYLLIDLCEQLHWLLYGSPRAETTDPPDDGEYRVLLTQLEGRAPYGTALLLPGRWIGRNPHRGHGHARPVIRTGPIRAQILPLSLCRRPG